MADDQIESMFLHQVLTGHAITSGKLCPVSMCTIGTGVCRVLRPSLRDAIPLRTLPQEQRDRRAFEAAEHLTQDADRLVLQPVEMSIAVDRAASSETVVYLGGGVEKCVASSHAGTLEDWLAG